MTNYLDNFNNCLEGSIPYCAGACPFNMEILDFIEKAGRGAAKAAYKVYRNAVGYPRIVSKVCPHPCQDVCPRADFGGSVQLHELEAASIVLTKDTSATDYNLPQKKERIAIIGAGASGMGALLRLSTKKYHVEVFEAADAPWGYLKEIIDEETLKTDYDEQLEFQDFTIHYNTEITAIKQIAGFDAVLVATGDGGNDFGLLTAISDEGDKYCCEYEGSGWFAVGGLVGTDLIRSMAEGLHMGTIIDNYLKTGHQYYPDFNRESMLCEGMVDIKDDSPAVDFSASELNKDDFAKEASRCVSCKCTYCRQHCDLCEFADKWPTRLKDEVIATTLEGKTELKATPARRLMSLCNQCGLCREVCPENIDMDQLFLNGRQKMFKQGKMPWAFHDYYIRDMLHANEEASLIRKPLNMETGKEYEKSTYAFFPGCQLGAAEPELIVKIYNSLLFQHPDTAIFMQCCGIPAEWAGDKESFEAILSDIEEKWISLGRPTMILACMTCYSKFKQHLPQIPIISIYELLENLGISGGCNSEDYSIFNPCSAREEDDVRQAVINLAEGMGVKLHPLEENEEYAKCCGYGGHGAIANEKYADYVAEKRIAEGDYPYITYCINCRDMFKTHGKDAVHILELIFGMGDSNAHMIHEHDHDHEHGHEEPVEEPPKPAEELLSEEAECDGICSTCTNKCGVVLSNAAKLPTVTERWKNRQEAKQALLEFFWNETIEFDDRMQGIKLVMTEEIKEKLNKKRIFEHEIAEVISFCQSSQRTILNTESGTLTGYNTIGHATYWVEYRVLDEKNQLFEVVNAYTHRLKIELEAVWNGVRKADEM